LIIYFNLLCKERVRGLVFYLGIKSVFMMAKIHRNTLIDLLDLSLGDHGNQERRGRHGDRGNLKKHSFA